MFNTLFYVETGEDDLQQILEEISQVTDLVTLGLRLGLHMKDIQKIQNEHKSSDEKKAWIIWSWLQRNIIPDKESCDPTWSELAKAVKKESNALSLYILNKYCKA